MTAYYQFLSHYSSKTSKTLAAKSVAITCVVTATTIAKWIKGFESSGDGWFDESRWGTHPKTPWLLADKFLETQAREWLYANSNKRKDSVSRNSIRNLKAADFRDYLNKELLPKPPHEVH